MKAGDLVRIYSHYKLEGTICIVTEVMPPTGKVRTRYRVYLPNGNITWFYNDQLRKVS